MTPSSRSKHTHFQWNHRIHEDWGKERLYFWRLGFAPTYDREKIVAGLDRVMAAHGVRSYGCYQLAGAYDLLLRIWLPSSVRQEAFEETLGKELVSADFRTCDEFVVSHILLHWIWGEVEQPRVPENGILEHRLPDDIIDRINSDDLTPKEFETFAGQNIIARFDPQPGIKFFIVIPAPDVSFRKSARSELGKRLRDILLAADKVKERSLYGGTGFGQFMIAGRVDHADFFEMHEQVTEKINAMGEGRIFGVRTYTHVTSKQGFLAFREALPCSEERPEGERPIEALLEDGESETLEFKGSAFLDLKRWLMTGQTDRSDKVTDEGVLRAIVGLLNSKGGKVIVGVLEASKFSEPTAQSKLSQFPTHQDYICCGVDLDFEKRDWDWFQNRLHELVNTRIVPSPTVSVTVQRQPYGDRTLCVISVRPSPRQWFYLKGDSSFYIRRGASTVPITGPDADSYKDEHPRGK